MALLQEVDDYDVMILALLARVKQLQKDIEELRMARRVVLGGGMSKKFADDHYVNVTDSITLLPEKKLVTQESSELTISSGEITVSGVNNVVDTEGDAAADDLDKINGGTDGMIIILRAADSARTVTVKNMSVPNGNIYCGVDFGLDAEHDTITLIYDAGISCWLRIARADNA